MTSQKLTIANLKALDRKPETKAVRARVLEARRIAKERRADVDAYIAPVFARFSFMSQWNGEPITCVRDLYLSSDEEQCQAFFAACDEAHRAHGYDMQPGFCPALVAEREVTKAEHAMLTYFGEHLGIPFGELICEARDHAVTLFLYPPGSQR